MKQLINRDPLNLLLENINQNKALCGADSDKGLPYLGFSKNI